MRFPAPPRWSGTLLALTFAVLRLNHAAAIEPPPAVIMQLLSIGFERMTLMQREVG